MVTKLRKRGRKPISRKAMTPAQRQARHRQRIKAAAAEAASRALAAAGRRQSYVVPHGYQTAKQALQALGHVFVRVPDSIGREQGGVFVDGAYLTTFAVIKLAELSPQQRRQQLDHARITTKQIAVEAVLEHMASLHVSFAELAEHREQQRSEARALQRAWEHRHQAAD
jgi:hypothetical protein